jgi:putative transposase
VRLPAGGLHHRPWRTEIFLPFVETLVGSIVANLIFGALWRGAPCKLRDCRYLLRDRDTKYTPSFRAIIASGRVEPLVLPACSPNLNAYAERWVRSVKEECLSKAILFGERSLRRALSEYVEHFHAERNHQGKGNVLLFPRSANTRRDGPIQCRERLGGLLRYYYQEAA